MNTSTSSDELNVNHSDTMSSMMSPESSSGPGPLPGLEHDKPVLPLTLHTDSEPSSSKSSLSQPDSLSQTSTDSGIHSQSVSGGDSQESDPSPSDSVSQSKSKPDSQPSDSQPSTSQANTSSGDISDTSLNVSSDSIGSDTEKKPHTKGTKRAHEPVRVMSKEAEAEMLLQRKKREKQEEERMKMQVLVSNFSEEQLNRYEMFRRAAFPKASIRRIMQSITGSTVAQNIVIAMSGISKVYVGEIVETALDVKESWGDTGPLQPKHLREAVRRMKQTESIPNTKYQKKLFR